MHLNESVNEISRRTHDLLLGWGVSPGWAVYVNLVGLLVILVALVYLLQYIVKTVLHALLKQIAGASHGTLFRHLLENRFPYFLALTVPFSLVKSSIPIVFADFPVWIRPLNMLTEVYLVFMVIWMLMAFIRSAFDVLRDKPAFRDKPMESYLQVIRIIFFLVGAVFIFSSLTGKSPAAFFTAMGAASAILLLMFRDTIMGFVASIQVSTNDMVRIGDWITMPKYGADGDVVEINLTTVKVQNFDKTITTIPTYTLISDSFQNWRGMQNAGGRRIKRAIVIKQSSIRYIREEELPAFKKIQGISAYIDERQAEIDLHNKHLGADRSIPVNGRNLTNAGLFRKYIEWYLSVHPGTHKELTLMVRQLAPSELGLPLELYAFANTTRWKEYEYTMADIFDHLIAAVAYFDLQLLEQVSGNDRYNVVLRTPAGEKISI